MDSFTVRDQRKPGHHWADNEIIDDFGRDIGPYGYCVYMFICRHAGNRDGRCFKTQGQIAESFGISTDTVSRAIKKLLELDLIRSEKKIDNTVTYHVRDVDKHTAHSGNPLPLTAARVPPTADTLPPTAASNKEERLSLNFIKTKDNTPPRNSDITIQAIAKAHPRNLKPFAAERAICCQLEILVRSMDESAALEHLLKRTQLFAKAMALYPAHERKWIPESHNWFSDGGYNADESLWVYHGESNGKQSITEKNKQALRTAIERDGW